MQLAYQAFPEDLVIQVPPVVTAEMAWTEPPAPRVQGVHKVKWGYKDNSDHKGNQDHRDLKDLLVKLVSRALPARCLSLTGKSVLGRTSMTIKTAGRLG